MKKLFVNSFIVFSLGTSGIALAKSNFDGVYAGIGVGHARGTDKGIEYKDSGNTFQGVTQRTNPDGALFYVFAGVNHVMSKNILLGAEADYEIRDHSHASFQRVDGSDTSAYPVKTTVKNSGSLRARLGYILNNDKTLPYITAGFSTISIKRTYGDTTNSLGNGTSLDQTTQHMGHNVGFGLEHFLTEKISLRSEYRYTRYMAKNIDASKIYYTGTIEKQRFRDQSIRLGLAYNF